MAIEFRCIRCGQRLRVAAANRGNRARCPTCNAIIDVPSNESAAASPVVLSRNRSDVIDYELFGEESQYVEITLDPGEMIVARLESLLYMSPGIAMEKAVTEETKHGGLLEKLSQVGRRILTRSSLRMMALCNVAERREVVAFAPSRPSRLVPLHLEENGQQITCQGDAILCAARGIEIRDAEVSSVSDVVTMYHMMGEGIAILQSNGQVFHRHLDLKKSITVRTASIMALSSEIDIVPYESVTSEDQTPMSIIRGPGEIWLKTGV